METWRKGTPESQRVRDIVKGRQRQVTTRAKNRSSAFNKASSTIGLRSCAKPRGRRAQLPLAGSSQSWGGEAQGCKQTRFNSVTAAVAEDPPRSEEHRARAGMRA